MLLLWHGRLVNRLSRELWSLQCGQSKSAPDLLTASHSALAARERSSFWSFAHLSIRTRASHLLFTTPAMCSGCRESLGPKNSGKIIQNSVELFYIFIILVVR